MFSAVGIQMLVSVNVSLWEAEAGGLQVQGQPGQFMETLSKIKYKTAGDID